MTIGRKHPPARTAALVVAVFSAAFAAGASAQDGAASDRAALEALYDATGGAEWTDGTHWKTPAPVGEWHGVTADAAGRVTGLDLGYNGLAGPLPPSLGSLDRLRWLDFEGNDLTGPIPVALGGLANLGSLSLARNALTGGVPAPGSEPPGRALPLDAARGLISMRRMALSPSLRVTWSTMGGMNMASPALTG